MPLLPTLSTWQQEFPRILRQAYEAFRTIGRNDPASSYGIYQYKDITFIGVSNSHKDDLDVQIFRSLLFSHLPSECSKLVQVVGDSSHAFSGQGFAQAMQILEHNVDAQTAIEYGYTATSHDANDVVNELLRSRPIHASRIAANVVFQSAQAVEAWACEASPHVKCFVLVYNDGDSETRFGDDVWLSDSIMSSKHADKLICFEGGPQAFVQAVNVLRLDVRVVAVTGLRRPTEGRFSAATLLRMLRDVQSDESAELDQVYQGYIADCVSMNEEQILRVQDCMQDLLAHAGCLGDIQCITISDG